MMLAWQSLMDVNQNYRQKVEYLVCIAEVSPKVDTRRCILGCHKTYTRKKLCIL